MESTVLLKVIQPLLRILLHLLGLYPPYIYFGYDKQCTWQSTEKNVAVNLDGKFLWLMLTDCILLQGVGHIFADALAAYFLRMAVGQPAVLAVGVCWGPPPPTAEIYYTPCNFWHWPASISNAAISSCPSMSEQKRKDWSKKHRLFYH